MYSCNVCGISKYRFNRSTIGFAPYLFIQLINSYNQTTIYLYSVFVYQKPDVIIKYLNFIQIKC